MADYSHLEFPKTLVDFRAALALLVHTWDDPDTDKFMTSASAADEAGNTANQTAMTLAEYGELDEVVQHLIDASYSALMAANSEDGQKDYALVALTLLDAAIARYN